MVRLGKCLLALNRSGDSTATSPHRQAVPGLRSNHVDPSNRTEIFETFCVETCWRRPPPRLLSASPRLCVRSPAFRRDSRRVAAAGSGAKRFAQGVDNTGLGDRRVLCMGDFPVAVQMSATRARALVDLRTIRQQDDRSSDRSTIVVVAQGVVLHRFCTTCRAKQGKVPSRTS